MAVYEQPINNTVVNQILYNYPYLDYVCFRTDSSHYIIYVSDDISFNGNSYDIGSFKEITYYTGGYNDSPILNVSSGSNISIASDTFVYSSLNNDSLKLRGIYDEQENIILYLMFFFLFVFLLFDKCIFRHKHTSNG